jgi:hypothetical protein
MEFEFASKLVSEGLARLRTLTYYQQWENEILGDPNDGIGLNHLDGRPMTLKSANDVYIFCVSLPSIDPEHQLLMAQNSSYDCVVLITEPEEFFRRIRNYLLAMLKGFLLHCGTVNYDRGREVDMKTLNSQKFHCNVFQKAFKFKNDIEYRLTVTDYNFTHSSNEFIDLFLGNCSDIISIRKLPNM